MFYSYSTTTTIWTKCFRPLIWDLGCISLRWWVNRGLGWTPFHTSKTIFIILMFIISGKPVGTWTIYFIYIYFYIRFKFESVDDNQGVKSGRCFRMWSSARYNTLEQMGSDQGKSPTTRSGINPRSEKTNRKETILNEMANFMTRTSHHQKTSHKRTKTSQPEGSQESG